MIQVMNNCYIFNIPTNTLLRKENMNYSRSLHGLQKMSQKIFAFGGLGVKYKVSKSAEVYDVVKNYWKNLPDMPEAGYEITCLKVKNKILISSY